MPEILHISDYINNVAPHLLSESYRSTCLGIVKMRGGYSGDYSHKLHIPPFFLAHSLLDEYELKGEAEAEVAVVVFHRVCPRRVASSL